MRVSIGLETGPPIGVQSGLWLNLGARRVGWAGTIRGKLAMRHLSFQAVSPAGLAVDRVTTEAARLLIVVHPVSHDAACTDCGQRSGTARLSLRQLRRPRSHHTKGPFATPLRPTTLEFNKS